MTFRELDSTHPSICVVEWRWSLPPDVSAISLLSPNETNQMFEFLIRFPWSAPISYSRADLDVGFIVLSFSYRREAQLGERWPENPVLYELIGFETQLGEEFARLRPLDFATDSADMILRMRDVLQGVWDVIRTVRAPSFFEVGKEYRVVTADVYFKVVSKTSEGLLVLPIGKGEAKTELLPWATVCARSCEELPPHPSEKPV